MARGSLEFVVGLRLAKRKKNKEEGKNISLTIPFTNHSKIIHVTDTAGL